MCESIKEEAIKEEIKEEESVEDPISIHKESENRNVIEDIKEDIKEEESIEDTSACDQETGINRLCIPQFCTTNILHQVFTANYP